MSAHEPRFTSVRTPDDRALEVAVAEPAGGVPLISHHGTPGAAGMFAPLLELAAERGLRLVTYSRPGYGGSDRRPGRAVGDCAADVAAIADRLGLDRFHTIGTSGGGPHALACGALLGDRVISTTIVGSVTPVDAEGLDWTAGMGEENLEEFAAARAGPEELKEFL